MSITLDQVNAIIGMQAEPYTHSYDERDVALYAQGIGAPADILDQDELKFVYELSENGFHALPTFAVTYISRMIEDILSGKIGNIEFNPMMLVHGEQYLQVNRPLPTSGTVTCYPRIANIYDKGSGMLVINEVNVEDESGETISTMQASMFIRGLGGFGGERGGSEKVEIPSDRPPDAVSTQETKPDQALLYRLSGDINPLHADPRMAAVGGFEKPILHGLATYGFAARAVLKHFGDNDPTRFKSMRARFSKHVYPGETLVTEMWRQDGQVVFQTKVKERDEVVLNNAVATVN